MFNLSTLYYTIKTTKYCISPIEYGSKEGLSDRIYRFFRWSWVTFLQRGHPYQYFSKEVDKYWFPLRKFVIIREMYLEGVHAGCTSSSQLALLWHFIYQNTSNCFQPPGPSTRELSCFHWRPIGHTDPFPRFHTKTWICACYFSEQNNLVTERILNILQKFWQINNVISKTHLTGWKS